MVEPTPASASVSAAVSPAIPPPTIAIRGAAMADARWASNVGAATATAPVAPARLRNSAREKRPSRSSAGGTPSRSAARCSAARR